MQQWEYYTAPLMDHILGELLNNFGEEGWELVTISSFQPGQMVGVFKRPKQDS